MPFLKSSFTTLICPLLKAKFNGVYPLVLTTVISAPFLRSSLIIST
jgi:hypothetical protein